MELSLRRAQGGIRRLCGPGRRRGGAGRADPARPLPLCRRSAGRGQPGPGGRGCRRASAHGEVPPGQVGRGGPARHRVPSIVRARGPGAGRPAKLYRRADGEVAVSLPERTYDLAGGLMAQAIETSLQHGTSVLDALDTAAAAFGAALADRARAAADARSGADAPRESGLRGAGRVGIRAAHAGLTRSCCATALSCDRQGPHRARLRHEPRLATSGHRPRGREPDAATRPARREMLRRRRRR